MSLTIAEAATHTRLSTHTLRYYEREGLLLDVVDRSDTGRRRYSSRDLEWIILVTRLRATGMPIRGIRRFAELVRAGDQTAAERLELLRAHRIEVLRLLAETQENLAVLDDKIAVYQERVSATASSHSA